MSDVQWNATGGPVTIIAPLFSVPARCTGSYEARMTTDTMAVTKLIMPCRRQAQNGTLCPDCTTRRAS